MAQTRSNNVDPKSKAKSPSKSKATGRVSKSTKSSKPDKSVAASKKRKAEAVEDEKPAKKSSAKKQKNGEEKRLKTFRAKAPQSFLLKLQRAQTQRMIVIGRKRSGKGMDLHEDIDIVGTTGNIYTVTIGRDPSCTCPDFRKGNECKHKVYALSTILRADYDLQYQRALLSHEVEEILSSSPPIPKANKAGKEEDHDGRRKPIEGECPICYMDFDPDNNELVWCKAACGNNMHKDCFQQWATSQRGQEVKCVYCRTPWQIDTENLNLEELKEAGTETGDGYVNVAEKVGISRSRDYSTYHQPCKFLVPISYYHYLSLSLLSFSVILQDSSRC